MNDDNLPPVMQSPVVSHVDTNFVKDGDYLPLPFPETETEVLVRRKRIAEEIEAAVQRTRDYIKFGHIKEKS